jgi:hypothetical protein
MQTYDKKPSTATEAATVAIPAGMVHGTEHFADNKGVCRTMHEGRTVGHLPHLPREVRRAFLADYFNAPLDQQLITKQWGHTSHYKKFTQRMFCKFGGLDEQSDYCRHTGKLYPDLNNHCHHFDCPLYGVLCRSPYGLKGHEVKTIVTFAEGLKRWQVADKLTREKDPITDNGVRERLAKFFPITDSKTITQLVHKITTMINYKVN